MTRSETPRRRRTAIDVRLVLGVLLVAGSVAGVVALVQSVDTRVPVYAAAAGLNPGDRIRAADLVERRVALDGADALYLGVGDIPAEGLVVTAAVRNGELVPAAAVGTQTSTTQTAIVVPLSGGVSAAVVAGARVDVWGAAAPVRGAAAASSGFGPPAVIAADATVARVVAKDGISSAAQGDSVEVLVPRDLVAALLQAIADGDALAVVPAGMPWAAR